MINRLQRRTLKNEMLFFDLVIVLVIFMMVITSTIFIYLEIFYNEIMVKNDTIAKSMMYQINEHSEMHIKGLENFAYNFENYLLIEKIEANELLNNLNSQDMMFIKVQILDFDGIVRYSSETSGSDIGYNASNQPYIKQLVNSGDHIFSNSFLSRDLNRIVTAFSMRTDKYIYLVHLDLEHFNDHLTNLSDVEEIQYMILDQTGTIIAATDTYFADTRTKYNTLKRSYDFFGRSSLLNINNKHYLINTASSDLLGWKVIILNDNQSVLRPIKRMIYSTIIITLLALIIYLALKRQRVNHILKSIGELKINFDALAKGNYKIRIHKSDYVEFEDLVNHFKDSAKEIESREEMINALNVNLENQVQERTTELFSKNRQLVSTVEELKSTQERLIESEKQAAFSKLITGVAHEINTPVGVSITSISYLMSKVEIIKDKYAIKELSNKQFKSLLENIQTSGEMITRNLDRASYLISSFKAASGDSFHDFITEYSLNELVENLVKSLQLNIDSDLIQIDVNIIDDIIINSYPAAMSQILTNLISNSIEHAFNKDEKGHIKINAYLKNDFIMLIYSDNGRGVSDDLQEKMFEPFFTTNRLNGGTGLGLSIVKNLVINKLFGSIELESLKNNYTKYIIQLPRVIESKEEE